MRDRTLYLKQWYQQNRPRILKQQQEYYNKNKATKLEKCKIYRQQNKDKRKVYIHAYRLRNIERMREYDRNWKNEQYIKKYTTKEDRYKALALIMSEKHKGKNNPFYGKTHSDEVKTKRLLQIFPVKDTSIEIKLQKALKNKGIEFETHKPIFGQPDIFIKPNICIFADGDYWHKIPKSIPRDKIVNVTLQLMGYKVLRFWEHDIKQRLEWCINQILKSAKSG